MVEGTLKENRERQGSASDVCVSLDVNRVDLPNKPSEPSVEVEVKVSGGNPCLLNQVRSRTRTSS